MHLFFCFKSRWANSKKELEQKANAHYRTLASLKTHQGGKIHGPVYGS